ncbi:pantoate--beta-alanine ligase, partial [Desulfobacterales bacterium HSG16]|nr:pantoate--beta-alanine ligase [Desulfobacterales bacterium HSG16]
MSEVNIIRTAREMQERSTSLIKTGRNIVFVPTMGFLHEGHLSLVREGKKHGDHIVMSIFVNPAQFGPNEDFDSYPRNFERDLKLAQSQGVDDIFAPEKDALYEENFQTYINLEKLPKRLCGISRPIFFQGVATVVAKLFNIVKPQAAVFGEKDYQQLQIIRRMVTDLNFDVKIIGGATVREPDGLAMSSRNAYLKPEQRESALSLSRSMKKAQSLVDDGTCEASTIIKEASDLIQSFPETAIDYISIVDPDTLEDMETIDRPARMILAVKVGQTRLIDN